MHNVTVKKADLLARVTANRDEHRELFLKAQAGYRARVIEELDRMLALAQAGDKLQTVVALEAPEDHTDEYNRAIDMLTMETRDEIVVDAATFRQLVRNEWAWFGHALLKNVAYASGGAFPATK